MTVNTDYEVINELNSGHYLLWSAAGYLMFKKLFAKNSDGMGEDELERLSIAFQEVFNDEELHWQWDERYSSVLAEFDSHHQEKVLAILGKHFTDYWYNSCISDAPSVVQGINDFLGGLKPGQMFFSTDTAKESFIYCAWWPWNVGKTISIRLSLVPTSSQEDKKLLQMKCQNWFNIQHKNQWGSV